MLNQRAEYAGIGTFVAAERGACYVRGLSRRHCERSEALQRSEAIQNHVRDSGLLRRLRLLAMTAARHELTFSRRLFRPSLAVRPPSDDRGRGECRELAAPMARQRKKCWRQVPQVQPRHPGIPRAMVLRLLRVLPGAPGLLATVCDNASTRCAGHQRRDARTTRLDRAHRAVRRRGKRPRCNTDTPTASRLNVRDDREAPLRERRDGDNQTRILIKRK